MPGLEGALEEEFGQRAGHRSAGWSRTTRLHEETLRAAHPSRRSHEAYREKEQLDRRRDHAPLREGRDAAGAGPAPGRSTWRRWTTCARASTCAAMRRRIRSRSTSARRSRCSRALTDRIKHEVIGILSKIQVRAEEDVEAVERQRRAQSEMNLIHEEAPELEPALADGEPELERGAWRGRPGGDALRPHQVADERLTHPLRARDPQGGPQRALSLRLGKEIQAVSRKARVASAALTRDRPLPAFEAQTAGRVLSHFISCQGLAPCL